MNKSILIALIVIAVAAGGYFFVYNEGSPEVGVSDNSSDLTADWRIYRNTKYNYEIKYPKDWTPEFDFAISPKAKIAEQATAVNFSGENMKVYLSREANEEQLAPKEWMKKYNIPEDFAPANFDPLYGFSEQTFKGLPALKQGDDLLSLWFIFKGTDVFATAAFGPVEPTRPFDHNVLVKTYEAMLSTFDLTAPPVANLGGYIVEKWEVYSDRQHGFEMQYPSKWIVELSGGYPTEFIKFNGGLWVGVEDTNFKSPEEWLKWYSLSYSTRSSIPQYSWITVGGAPAIKFNDPEEQGGLGGTIAFIRNGKLYRIFPKFPIQEVVDQIFSTFKFIK